MGQVHLFIILVKTELLMVTKLAQGNSDENGQGDFYYAVPTGFLGICPTNF